MTPVEMRRIEKSPAVRSLRKEQARQRREGKKGADEKLERGLKDSFPASDPVAVTNTTTSGEPDLPGAAR